MAKKITASNRPRSRKPVKTRKPRVKRKIGRKILAGFLVAWLIFLGVRHQDTLLSFVGVETSEISGNTVDSTLSEVENTKSIEKKPVKISAVQDTISLDSLEVKSPSLLARFNPGPLVQKFFKIEVIDLRGVYSIPRDSLLAKVEYLYGQQLMKTELGPIAKELEKHSRIREASIRRQLPRKLVIEIKERREVAQVICKGIPVGIDKDGIILSNPQPGWLIDVPVITGYKSSLKPGEKIDSPSLIDALDWINAARHIPRVETWLTEINVNRNGIGWVHGASGCSVQPGEHNVYSQVATLDAFLEKRVMEKEGKRVLDLRFPGFLILRDNRQG